MLLTLEIDLNVDYHETGDNKVSLLSACFPGFTQNILQFLSVNEQDNLQQALEDAYHQAAIDKVEALLERKAMAGDARREIAKEYQREALAERQAQRGGRLA
jgi:hypothetical protein